MSFERELKTLLEDVSLLLQMEQGVPVAPLVIGRVGSTFPRGLNFQLKKYPAILGKIKTKNKP